MRSIYLDSNVLIAFYASGKSEAAKKQMVQKSFDVFAKARDVWLCTSVWTVTETVNILISSKKMHADDVSDIERRLRIESFGNLRLHFLEVSPDTKYDFAQFFDDVRDGILRFHSGVGDVIHSVIMKNNGVDHVLTFDEKNDFKQIPGLKVLHPKDF
jgi:predicted nucleic acid-binding protein